MVQLERIDSPLPGVPLINVVFPDGGAEEVAEARHALRTGTSAGLIVSLALHGLFQRLKGRGRIRMQPQNLGCGDARAVELVIGQHPVLFDDLAQHTDRNPFIGVTVLPGNAFDGPALGHE